jgi:purine-binding chemotaxis protein CheW
MSKLARSREVTESPVSGRRRFVVFRVAEQMYGLPIEAVREIVPLAQLTRPPSLPSLVAGFLNLGGTAVAVVRLSQLFELPAQPPGLYTPLVVLQSGGVPKALLVDEVLRVAAIAEPEIVPIAEAFCFNDCALGMTTLEISARRSERTTSQRTTSQRTATMHVVLLSAERLLSAQEERRLAELSAIETERLAMLREDAP